MCRRVNHVLYRLTTFFFSFLLVCSAQAQNVLNASQRVLPEIGHGFRAVRRGPAGAYYVLRAPGAAVEVFDAAGKKSGQIPAQPSGAAAIVFGVEMDTDAAGRIYVADRGGNAVKIYAPDGSLLLRVPVVEPTGVAALPGGEFAVSSLRADQLITVYDLYGSRLRSFGDLVALADSPELNRRLNLGILRSDNAGNLYYAFEYVPEPTIREYDNAGYLKDEFLIRAPNVQAEQDAHAEIARAQTGMVISPLEIISALGVDQVSQELWLAFGDRLVLLDPGGHPSWSAQTYGPHGVRLEPRSILVEADRLLLGADPVGLYAATPPNRSSAAH